jgi:hypothetical protein
MSNCASAATSPLCETVHYCQIVCRIADLRALPINHCGLAVFPNFEKQVLRKEISMQHRRGSIMGQLAQNPILSIRRLRLCEYVL